MYPTDLGQTYVTPNTTDKLNNPSHTARHQAESEEIQALKVKVGIDSSAVAGSIDYKLTLKEVTANKDTTTTLGTSDTKYPSQKAVKTYIDDAIAAVKSAMMPVGSYYINETDSTNPATLLGFGTWSAVADKTIIGKGSGTFATAGATGGSETHTLVTAEMPAHSHTVNINFAGQPAVDYLVYGYGEGKTYVSTTTVGSGSAHNNLPPYIVAYIWKRTA